MEDKTTEERPKISSETFEELLEKQIWRSETYYRYGSHTSVFLVHSDSKDKDSSGNESLKVYFEDVIANINEYIAACMQKFTKPAHIREKVENLTGYYRRWSHPENDKIREGIIERTLEYRTDILTGLENMDMSGLPKMYRNGGLDHEISNLVWSLGRSQLRVDPEVVKIAWQKVKQTPNGCLQSGGMHCELEFILDYAMKNPDTFEEMLKIPQLKEILRKGYGIREAISPLITDYQKYLKYHEAYWGGRSKPISSDEFSKQIIAILDKAIC
jgi:hypothetical protein